MQTSELDNGLNQVSASISITHYPQKEHGQGYMTYF